MEAIVKNVERTTELLAVSQTETVQRWDKQTLDRAFQWTQYCQHVYTRFHANPTVRDILEKQLQVTNESLRTTFHGYTDITFSDLSQCQHLLLVGLLNNAAVPSSVVKLLFDTITVGGKYKDATGHCTELIEVKSACKVLSAIHLKRSTSFPGPDADVLGMTMMEMLDILLSPATGGSKVGLAEKLLDNVLQTCGENENFPEVVAAALLSRKNDKTATKMAPERVSFHFILDWLQQHHSLLHNMCSTLPIGLLMDLHQQSVRFRVTYGNMLKQWGSQLEYDVGEGEWVQMYTTDGVSFKTLSDHYRSLLGACPSTKEDVERELTELKVADGDFDVRGLSVWGDLLSELNTV